MTVFIIVAVVGLALTALALFADGIGDALDFAGTGSGIISGASIGGLISGIGFGGWLGLALTDRPWLVAVISGATGLAVAGAAAGWYHWLRRAQGDEKDLAIGGIVGTTGAVRSVSRDDPTTGTVAATYLGAVRTMQFTSGAPLKAGAAVRIAALIDPETVRVEPLD
ncbi:MAG: hypothetical protein LBD70_01365 [Bifidobacteriaceae bacterium]|jgi:hypothetical protein|nr:hypothetical protein [Bifidobacteriaceae bacterium]